jgi:hypothetical protein
LSGKVAVDYDHELVNIERLGDRLGGSVGEQFVVMSPESLLKATTGIAAVAVAEVSLRRISPPVASGSPSGTGLPVRRSPGCPRCRER